MAVSGRGMLGKTEGVAAYARREGRRKRAPSGAACRRRSGGELAAPASVSGGSLQIFVVLIRANLESLDIDERLF